MVAKLTTSSGPRMPSGAAPGPDVKMMSFPPVTRTSSRAFVRKFWRYRRAMSDGTDLEGNSPAAYGISNWISVSIAEPTTHDDAVALGLPDLFPVQSEVVRPLVQRDGDDGDLESARKRRLR